MAKFDGVDLPLDDNSLLLLQPLVAVTTNQFYPVNSNCPLCPNGNRMDVRRLMEENR